MNTNAIWRLTPIDGTTAEWERSVIQPRPIDVRAPSEEAARRLASAAFGTARWNEPATSPWAQDGAVQCDRMDDDGRPTQGRPEILAIGSAVPDQRALRRSGTRT